MDGILRRSLVLLLAIALIAGGTPASHAMPCAPDAPPGELAHRHGGPQAGMAGHLHVHDAMPAIAPMPMHRDHRDHGEPAIDLCKCLNCGMCASPGIAPLVRNILPERRAVPVRYGRPTSEQPFAMIFIDPGIPIVLA
jgi:hypothetical protein